MPQEPTSSASTPQTPLPLAIVVCDAVHIDPLTRKNTILGTFSGLRLPHFPYTVRQLAVYVALTDVRGRIPFELRLVRVDSSSGDDETIFSTTGEFESSDPLAITELAIGLADLEFYEPGDHRFQFLALGQPVIERRVTIEQR